MRTPSDGTLAGFARWCFHHRRAVLAVWLIALIAEVAEIVGRTPGACRQLASSARRRIRASQAPAPSTARQARVVRDFKQAWEAGDIDTLIGLLDRDVTLTGDGGGLVRAAVRPREGAEEVAHFLFGISRARPANGRLLERSVNGQPGLVGPQDGVTVVVYTFEVAGDQIHAHVGNTQP